MLILTITNRIHKTFFTLQLLLPEGHSINVPRVFFCAELHFLRFFDKYTDKYLEYRKMYYIFAVIINILN